MRSIFLVFLLVAPVAAMGAGTPATSGLKGAEWAVTFPLSMVTRLSWTMCDRFG